MNNKNSEGVPQMRCVLSWVVGGTVQENWEKVMACLYGIRGESMTHKQAVKYLEQLETACQRAEESKKDIDLLVALRAIYLLMKEEVIRNEKKQTI